jgi:DNA-binding NarL/FixJ family response regulator
MMNVFVVDDHTAIREGYKAILERTGEYSVTGEAASAEDLLSRLDSGEPFPDSFIVDISLPGMNGIELIDALKARSPAPVIVLSMHRRYDYIAQALIAGASGYVSKDAAADSIVSALAAAAMGGCYLDPISLKLFIDEVVLGQRGMPHGGAASPAPQGEAGLSDREAEVLGLLASGKRAEEIASLLGLSQKTVENHLSNITLKLGAKNRFELYRLAARMGRE